MSTTLDQLVAGAKRLIDTIGFDDSGIDGRGGNGGLISRETIRASDELRLLLSRLESEEKGMADVVPEDVFICPDCGGTDFREQECATDDFDDGLAVTCNGCGFSIEGQNETIIHRAFAVLTRWKARADA
jgi:hypothetical protein